ncbi:MAG: methyltransferase domain-containing protein [Gemmatimonadales bacterium]
MPTVSEIRVWYDRLYASKGLASMRPREAYPGFLNVLAIRPGARLLDVSCGAGFLLEAAAARGVHAFGIDLSAEAVRLAAQTAPDAGVAVGAGERLPFRAAAFDYVSCLGSLEHFVDMAEGLQEMLRVAAPDARLCIMVPNGDFIGWKLLGRRGTAQQDINERLLPLREWRALFEANGLELLRVLPDRWHARRWRLEQGRRSGWGRRALGLLLELGWSGVPLRWQYQFIFVLRRRSTPPSAR